MNHNAGIAGSTRTVVIALFQAFSLLTRPDSHRQLRPRAPWLGVVVIAIAPIVAWSGDRDSAAQLEEITVTATRSPTLISDESLRVEAVPAEEIEENLTIQPGNVSP